MQAHAHTRKHAFMSHERINVVGKKIILYIQIAEISRHGNWELAVENQHRKVIIDSRNKNKHLKHVQV